MPSLVGHIMKNLQESKKHARCIGLLCLFCAIWFAILFYLEDFSITGRAYTMSATANNSYVVPVYHRNRSLTILSEEANDSREKDLTNHSLLILVMSAPANLERRMVIRQTWALKLPKRVKVFFVVGEKSLLYGTKTKIVDEKVHNNDLIVLPTLEDDYKQLTAKVVLAMKWIIIKLKFDYVLKVDDDTFVRVNELLKNLQLKPTEGLYWGYFNNGSEIVKKGKWAEPKTYICDRYVSYALGGGYVLSKDLVKYITDNSGQLKIYMNEDVSVGTWLAPLELNRAHDARFRMAGDCKEEHILLHYASILDMKKFNKSLAANNTLCGSQLKSQKTGSIIESSEGNGTLIENESKELKAEKTGSIIENSRRTDTLMENKHLQIMGKINRKLTRDKNKGNNEMFTKSNLINGK